MLVHLLLPLFYGAIFFLSFGADWMGFVVFLVGLLIGFQLLFIDRIVHAFYLYPDTEFNQLIRGLWARKDIGGMVRALAQAETLQEKLLTRSTLFLIVYIFMTIFVLTSTGSVLGIGIMLGMGLHYTYDFWRYSRDPAKFSKQFLWQVKRSFTAQEIRGFVVGWTAFFIILTLLALF